MKAIWNDTILAESENTVIIEGNHYFPADSIKMEYFQPGKKQTVCPWKGTADYYDIHINGEINGDAAWYYAAPKEAAINIKDHLAFWKGVVVIA